MSDLEKQEWSPLDYVNITFVRFGWESGLFCLSFQLLRIFNCDHQVLFRETFAVKHLTSNCCGKISITFG
jgi:hypothetical protein